MANISKPDGLNLIWSSTGDILKPSDSKISQGWSAEIPPRQWFNYIDNKQDQGLAHINQHGIPVWDSVTEYQANSSYVQGSNGKIYFCVSTNTNQNPVSDTTNAYWLDYQSSGYVVLNSNQTWTVPLALRLGIKKPKVIAVGAGGGGGAGDGASGQRGAGGGAGGTTIQSLDLSGVSSIAVNIGSGGLAAATTSADGGAGGTTTFGSYLTATGGSGGVGYSASKSPSGGAGGVGSKGAINLSGGYGSDGQAAGGSGDGGASYLGGGGRGGQGTGVPGQAPGSGAGGGRVAGATGAPGIIIIEW